MSARSGSRFIAALCFAFLLSASAVAAARLRIKIKPVKEQTVNTPVPVFVEIRGNTKGMVVQLHYHPASQKHWRHRTMKPMGKGFGALIPCKRVHNEAIVEYYIRVEKDGKTIAKSGSEKSPYAVAFVASLKGPAPALPGKDPPHKCRKKKKHHHEESATTGESGSASSSGGGFESSPEGGGAFGQHHHHHKLKRVWIDFGIAQDIAVLGGKDVCSESGEKNAFYCFRDDGQQYLGYPVPGEYDKISTGFALSATRLVAGLDYVLGAAAIGARIGVTVHGGSPKIQGGKSSLPVLASARLEYWFAKHAYATKGFAAYLVADAGLAEADASHRVAVVEDRTRNAKQVNPDHQHVDAWKRMGDGFAGIGLGGFVPTGRSGGLVIELQGRYLFPASGFVVAPAISYALGF